MNLMMIRNLSEHYEGGLKKLASDIGMSEANLHRCINLNRISANDLELIAIRFGVDITVFFDDEAIKNKSRIKNDEVDELKKEIERLRKLKLPTHDAKAFDVSLKFFEATKEMFSYFNQMECE